MQPCMHSSYPLTILIHPANVPRVKPAFLINGLPGLGLFPKVAHEDVAATETDLPMAIGPGVVNLILHTYHHLLVCNGQEEVSYNVRTHGENSNRACI